MKDIKDRETNKFIEEQRRKLEKLFNKIKQKTPPTDEKELIDKWDKTIHCNQKDIQGDKPVPKFKPHKSA